MDFQEYGYFDSEIVGYDEEGFPRLDRAMNSDMFALFIARLVSNGVLGFPADCLMVQADEGMTLNVKPGFIIINGHFGYNPKPTQIILDRAPTQYRRITAIVARLNKVERKIELIYQNGETAVNPSPPEILQPQGEGDFYDLCLATIRIESNQTVITQSNITDTRYDSSVCGVVTQLIDHLDTSVFFAQFNAFYKEFVEKSNISYKEFCNMALVAYNDLTSKMNQYYDELSERGEKLHEKYKKEVTDWIESIKNTLASVENGELLMQINEMLNSMRIATDTDIENIIGEKYVDDDDDSSIFETASDDDIEAIINGTYIDSDDDSDDEIITTTEEKVVKIVNQTFITGGKA